MIFKEFIKQYGTDEDCLRKIFVIRYGFKPYCVGCKTRRKFFKKTNRSVYECMKGHQVSPLTGTIFTKSSTPLRYWFYTIWLMSATRGGISAKQIERELGVTYKTAWRMMKQIRILMGKREGSLLKGIVEVDESFWNGAAKNRRYVANYNEKPQKIIMGMVEREGNVIMKKIETTGRPALMEQVEKYIDKKALVMHDQWPAYTNLHKLGYAHYGIDHGKTYVSGKAHTNNIEGLWGRIKPGIKGVYRKVSSKYIESYMDEYCFRYNNRKTPDQMLEILLNQI